MEVREYAPGDVVMTFGGATVEGWESIRVRRMQPSFRMIQGIRDGNARVRVGNTAAEIEITLAQTSPTNYIFSKIVELDEKYGTGRIEVTIRDVLTGEGFQSTKAYLEAPAEIFLEGDVSNRTWKMTCLSSTFIRSTGGALGALVDKVTSLF